MFVENLDVFFNDFGLEVNVSGKTFLGLLSRPDDQMQMGGVNVQTTNYELTVKTADVGGNQLKSGVQLALRVRFPVPSDAGSYRIRDVMLLDDGAFSKLTLTKI